MGYCASWSGYITFTQSPDEETVLELNDKLNINDYDEETKCLSVCDDNKYYDDIIKSALELAKPITKCGEIEFTGEDEDHWRFIFKDGDWVEEHGNIYYESDIAHANINRDEFIGNIIDIMQDYVVDDIKGDVICGEWYDIIAKKLDELMRSWKVFR